MTKRPPAAAVLWCLFAALWLSSCSTGAPPGARMGTPEWYWLSAKETFAAGDLSKTQEHLEKIMASEHALKSRATTWHLVLLGGMARGHRDLAEAYEEGVGATKTHEVDFRRAQAENRRFARQYCIGLAEEASRLQKEMGKGEAYSLEFKFPLGGTVEPVALGRVRKGMFPQESERLSAQRAMVQRGVLLETAAVLGLGDDTAKAAEMFKTPPVQVPNAVFLFGVAQTLTDQSAIFDRKKLHEPDKRKVMLSLAASLVKPASEASDAGLKKKAKELQARIEKEQKTLPKGL